MSIAKAALVTGGARGIGAEISRALAAAGFRVAVHYGRGADAAEALRASLPGSGHCTLAAELASGEIGICRALIEAAVAKLGRLDVLVNNAGLFDVHPLHEQTDASWAAAWQKTLGLNLLAPANLSFVAGRWMAAHGGGRIVNVSSRGAFRGEPEAVAYGASKAGLNQMSQSMAKALAKDGVLVYAVAPGFVGTDMAKAILDGPHGDAIRAESPLGRVTTPAEVAAIVRFCATDAPAAMTGAIVDVNGASYLRS